MKQWAEDVYRIWLLVLIDLCLRMSVYESMPFSTVNAAAL